MKPAADTASEAEASRDFFQVLADGAPVMIWMSGLDMGCFYFNRSWLEFRGRTTEQEFGNGWAEGVHPEDLKRCVGHYVNCFEERVAFAMSYRLQNAAGEFRWILDRGAPHFSQEGTFLGFFGGCAEMDGESAISRNAELGRSLGEMTEVARVIATEEGAAAALRSPILPLPLYARSLSHGHEQQLRQMKHAAAEIGRLAADMLNYRSIPEGACLK